MQKKAEITRAEYLQLLGLIVLGRKHARSATEIERTMAEMIGVESGGHTMDVLWDDRIDLDEMLHREGVSVGE